MEKIKTPNHEHAWKGSWNRPMLLDEDSVHPFTIARMTDHNVRGVEEETKTEVPSTWENEGGTSQ